MESIVLGCCIFCSVIFILSGGLSYWLPYLALRIKTGIQHVPVCDKGFFSALVLHTLHKIQVYQAEMLALFDYFYNSQ